MNVTLSSGHGHSHDVWSAKARIIIGFQFVRPTDHTHSFDALLLNPESSRLLSVLKTSVCDHNMPSVFDLAGIGLGPSQPIIRLQVSMSSERTKSHFRSAANDAFAEMRGMNRQSFVCRPKWQNKQKADYDRLNRWQSIEFEFRVRFNSQWPRLVVQTRRNRYHFDITLVSFIFTSYKCRTNKVGTLSEGMMQPLTVELRRSLSLTRLL